MNDRTDKIEHLSTAEHLPKIGEILLRHTSLSPAQLEEALKLQKSDGGLLGDILVRKNMIPSHEILRALCIQIGITYLDDIKSHEIDPKLVSDIPINYAKMKEAIPLQREMTERGETLVVAVADPFNDSVADDLRALTGLPIRLVASTSLRIQEAINRVYERSTTNLVEKIEGEFNDNYDLELEGPIDILEATEDDAPVIKFVNSLIFRAVKEKASDIHIEPFEKEFVVRFRVDGVLYDIIRQPKRAHAAISSRIKVMGTLDIAEKRLPQDGRIKIKIAGKDIDIRLSTVPTIFGERLVMRILEQTGTVLELEQLGFSEKSARLIEKLIFRKYGIILVTGPTGSGKSTTLSACLVKLNSPERNILTVEDPIEYQIPGINQVQVNAKIELTFARALRAFLRQNPDIIMVGEIRDKETAEIAINASLTGHLVLSTLHTNDSSGAATRLIDMGVEPFLVASSLLGIVAQRLIRKVCSKCREPHDPSAFELQELGLSRLPAGVTLYRAVGCPACSQTGYSGRTVIHELMVVDDDIRSLIVKNADSGTIKRAAVERGMITLREDGVAKVLSGATTVDELMRATHAEV
ncbi:MAG: type II secretion system protein GspE [Bdellovibrionales bacterium GWB1_55_8]|nr:MAG: type II secretion system protein GspE [Bdellovibrionales bacterium GWB1_55_8]